MQCSGPVAGFLLTVAAVLAGGHGVAVASERYRCTTYMVRECSPAGCREVAASADFTLDVPARSYRYCFKQACRTGGVETWHGRLKPEDNGIIGFSELGQVRGFTGSLDLDKGKLVLIDEPHYLFGRCVTE